MTETVSETASFFRVMARFLHWKDRSVNWYSKAAEKGASLQEILRWSASSGWNGDHLVETRHEDDGMSDVAAVHFLYPVFQAGRW